MLAIVVAVVLLLAARAWRSVAPEASEIMKPALPELSDQSPEGTGSGSSSNLPRLGEMQEDTAAHADRVREALEQTD